MASVQLARPSLKDFQVESALPTPPPSRSTSHLSVDAAESALPAKGLAARLRDATVQAHQDVMQPKIVSQLVSGQLSSDMYTRYLMILYTVYKALEDSLAQHASHPHLSTTYDPALLARTDALELDIAHYNGDPDWVTSGRSRLWNDVRREDGLCYASRLRDLGAEDGKHTLLLAHAYVRYLGDLSGGQAVARNLRKAYSLPDSGEGSAFYEFFLPPSPSSSSGLPIRASLDQTKDIKNWFRAGLDKAGELMSEEQCQEVVQEARYAFELNIAMFNALERTLHNAEAELAFSAKAKAKAKAKAASLVVTRSGTSAYTFLALSLAVGLSAFIVLRDWTVFDLFA